MNLFKVKKAQEAARFKFQSARHQSLSVSHSFCCLSPRHATGVLSKEASEKAQWLPAGSVLEVVRSELSPALEHGEAEGSGAKSLPFLLEPGWPSSGTCPLRCHHPHVQRTMCGGHSSILETLSFP